MQVRFLIDQKSTGDKKLVVGWTVLPPGAKHDRHRHHNCDEFFIVVKGRGMSYTADGKGEEPAGEGDVVYSPRGAWHGFNNASSEEGGAGLGLEWRGLARSVGLRSSSGCCKGLTV